MKKKTVLIIVAMFATLTLLGHAQAVATRTSALGWNIRAESLADAQAYTYSLYVDTLPPVELANVACETSTGPIFGEFLCAALFPALTPGTHSIALTAKLGAEESDKSDPLPIRMVVVQRPTGLEIISIDNSGPITLEVKPVGPAK